MQFYDFLKTVIVCIAHILHYIHVIIVQCALDTGVGLILTNGIKIVALVAYRKKKNSSISICTKIVAKTVAWLLEKKKKDRK